MSTTTTKSLFALSKSTIERMKKEHLIALLEAEGFKGIPEDIKRTDLSTFAFECIAFRKEVAEAEASDLEKFGPNDEESFVAEVEDRAEFVHMVDALIEQPKDQIDDTPIDFEKMYTDRLVELSGESVENIVASAQQYIDLGVAGTRVIALQMMIEDLEQELESSSTPVLEEPELKFSGPRSRQDVRKMDVLSLFSLAQTYSIVTEGKKRDEVAREVCEMLFPSASKDPVQQYTDRLSTESKGSLCREMYAAGYRPAQIQVTLSMHPSHVQTVLSKVRKAKATQTTTNE